MPYEVCPKCYGTLNQGHECGPATLAKDDLCPKCLIILEDCSKAVFNYAQDMLQIERTLRNEGKLSPGILLDQVQTIMKRREKRLLKGMENGRIERG